MGYKVKRIMMRPNGVEKQVRPSGWTPGANTIAYYPLNSTTTVSDLSGNNKNLTNYNNVPFGTYQGVNCASFNGSSQYLGLGAKFTLGNTYTILSWYWHNSGNNGMVYCQGASSSLYPSLGLGYGVNYSNISVHSGTGSDRTWLTSTVGSNNGKWVLGVFVFNNGSVSLYENNVVTKTGYLSAPGTGGENFYVGMWRAGYNYFSGLISNLIIENKARTAQEIADYYNLTKADYEPKPQLFDFTQSTIADLQTQGWLIGDDSSHLTIDSNGIGLTTSNGANLAFPISGITSSSIITIRSIFNASSIVSWGATVSHGLGDSAVASPTPPMYGSYKGFMTNSGYKFRWYNGNGASASGTDITWAASTQYEETLTYNLASGTLTSKITTVADRSTIISNQSYNISSYVSSIVSGGYLKMRLEKQYTRCKEIEINVA